MGKFVTIENIAQQLGVSHSTVSRALRNHPRISEGTKIKVHELADRLGYQKNINSSQLSSGESKLIGLIVPDIRVNFFATVTEQVQEKMNDAGYAIILFSTGESISREMEAIEKCMTYRVDGVLAAHSMETNTFDHFERLIRHEIPLVFFDRVANFLPVPKVILNDYQGSYDATKHLIRRGCRKIAHISGSINLNNSNNRLYGYLDALNEYGIQSDEKLIHYMEGDQSSIQKFLINILKNHQDLDGLSVFNDYMANYAINILKTHNKRIPEDIAVIGFSDEPVATFMDPQLSTTQEIGPKMGQLAAQKMLSILNGHETVQNEKIVIKPEVVVRASTERS